MAWPISATLAAALRTGGAVRPVVHTVDDTAQRTGDDFDVLSGQVAVKSGTGVRRTLSCEVADDATTWEALRPAGVRLAAALHYPALDERVPLGVFDVDTQRVGHGPGGGVAITAPDLWQTIVRARFLVPKFTPAGDGVQQALVLVTDVTGRVPVVLDDAGGPCLGAVWPRERDKAIASLLKSAGAEGGFDVTGRAFARPIPTVRGAGVWTIDYGQDGVLVDATRSRSRTDARSQVVVTPTAVDGTLPYDPVLVEDTRQDSATFVGGPFGRVPAFYDTELVPTPEQAVIAGTGILQQLAGLTQDITVTAALNPALDAGDTVLVRTPRRGGAGGGSERYLVDALTVPLTPGDAQSLTLRGSRAVDLVDGVN